MRERTLWTMGSLATPMALRVAATLRLADHLGTDGATAAEVAAATGTDVSALERMLEHLRGEDVLVLDAHGRYRLTELGGELADPHRRALLDLTTTAGRVEQAFVELLHTVRTGEAAYRARYGRPFWDDLDARPELRISFDAQMRLRLHRMAGQVAQRYPWSRFAHLVDVGGGDATLTLAVLAAAPALRATVVDLPPTAEAARAASVAAGCADRVTVVPGSFFDPLPAGADAYLLSDILHNWDDAGAAAILARCAEAAGRSGVVLVVEGLRTTPADGADAPGDTIMDLSMLVQFGGRERTVPELARLARACGLAPGETRPVADGRTLVELRPA